MLYTFPQSVGIAGGRPSSSYYFVGSQADNLFYLDPHHARPAVALRPAPPPPSTLPPTPPHQGHHSHETETTPDESEAGSAYPGHKRNTPPNHASTNSPSSVRTGSSTFSYHAALSPSPLQQEFLTSGKSTESKNRLKASLSSSIKQPRPHTQPNFSTHSNTARLRSASVSVSSTHSEALHENDLSMFTGGGVLDPVQEHYVTAYPAVELKTYHCERIRKMPLSGLDPSMLIGFVCRDEGDWVDFRRRVGELPKTVFSVQEEPPSCPSDIDDNMGLESFSEPDPDDFLLDMDNEEKQNEDEDEDEDEERDEYFDTRLPSASTSTSSASASQSGSASGHGVSMREVRAKMWTWRRIL
ncbi:hypothetical protein H2248_002967 [Termitomyces sp. 'cryptogamus']|nr:hypothetical protein H2248_002967 [Termitomyces sp. 'cryptogamus']